MLEVILKGLEENKVNDYIVVENEKNTVELYLVEQELDMGRRSKVKSYEVKICRKFEEGQEKLVYCSTLVIYPRMSKEDVYELIAKGYNDNAKVVNKSDLFTEIIKEEDNDAENLLSQLTLEDAANKVKDIIYSATELDHGTVKSLDIFVNKTKKRIITSEGKDIIYEKFNTNGEVVTRWIEEKQRELTHNFRFNDLNESDITNFVKDAIQNSVYIETKDEEEIIFPKVI